MTIDFLDKDKDGLLSREEGSKIFGESSIVMTYRDMIKKTFGETADKMNQVSLTQAKIENVTCLSDHFFYFLAFLGKIILWNIL